MPNDTLIRWQDARREQLGAAITLLFGLSSASLAYCGSLLTDDAATFGGWRTFWFLAATLLFAQALIASVAVTITRLTSTRDSVTIVRMRDDASKSTEVQRLRGRVDRFDAWTWRIFRIQLFTFLLGAISLLIAVGQIFHAKLFP
jgi:hypothetical protein